MVIKALHGVACTNKNGKQLEKEGAIKDAVLLLLIQ
jgi:hypothetical protein